MVVMPSVNQWAPKYTFYHPEYTLTVLSVFKAKAHEEYYRVDKTKVVPLQNSDVLGSKIVIFSSFLCVSLTSLLNIQMFKEIFMFNTFYIEMYFDENTCI